MIEGMVGWNGLSLVNPSYPIPGWLRHWADDHGILFISFTPLTYNLGVEATDVVPKLMLGLVIVWALPNTQEWIGYVESRSHGLMPRWQPALWITWVLFGTALALLTLVTASGPASEFLYFQF